MRKPSRRHGLDMRNILSALAMWTPHPPTALTTIHDHVGTMHTTLGANDVRALRGLGQLHRSATTQTQPTVDPTDCSTVAETIPSCDRWTPQNRGEVLIVDNTKRVRSSGGRGKPRGRTGELVPPIAREHVKIYETTVKER